ncbi:hypothetical protein D3C80_1251110 [compost metagenome]
MKQQVIGGENQSDHDPNAPVLQRRIEIFQKAKNKNEQCKKERELGAFNKRGLKTADKQQQAGKGKHSIKEMNEFIFLNGSFKTRKSPVKSYERSNADQD